MIASFLDRCLRGLLAVALTIGGVAPVPASAYSQTAPERFDAGANSSGDACTAVRDWITGHDGILRDRDQPFSITCSGIAAAEAQGYVSAPGKPLEQQRCTAAATLAMEGIGPVEVRRCLDDRLGAPAVEIRFTRRGKVYQGAALETTLAPLEAALRVVSGASKPPKPRAPAKPSLDLATVAAAPAGETKNASSGVTPQAALSEGVAAILAGRMLDASRILNDAVRAFVDAPPATRVDLRLAAGLADSNLSQFDAAQTHFATAQALLDSEPGIADASFKQAQLATYRGLDLINQRRWADAVATLAPRGGAGGTLADPMTISRLNQEAVVRNGAPAAAISDTQAVSRELVTAQKSWALSVAYLALGDLPKSRTALSAAAQAAAIPVHAIKPESIVWMRAAIERQRGRIEAREGNYAAALASFDCAVDALRGGVPPAGAGCMLPSGERLPDTALNAPLLVETQLERASIRASDPAQDPKAVLADYDAAIGSMSDLTGTGTVSLAALERYFALLSRETPSAARDEEFFRGMQTIGEPAIAREYAQLQKLVSANPEVADLLRSRTTLERQLIRLRSEISSANTAAPASEGQASLAELEGQRKAAGDQLITVNNKLLAANGIGALEDQPATVANIRDSLQPGEVYLKIVALRSTMFGIAIGRDQTIVFPLGANVPRIDALVQAVLDSAHSDEAGVIHPFEVERANQLFVALTGPAAPMLGGARRIIYNPAGSLRQLPLAILVIDPASVAAYKAQPAKGDYSHVAFVARNAEIMTALSPRAFLRARNDLPPSKAPNPFLGLGENAAPAPVSDTMAARAMPFDCTVSYGSWAQQLATRAPISAHEIGVAATALGVEGAPEITGATFTDVNLLQGDAAPRLSQYQVLHFATHGLPETAVPVREASGRCMLHVPPSLVTTMAAPDADGTIESDGLLSFGEVAQLHLDANLVVLSACVTWAGASSQTGQRGGVELSSPALDGLVRSFIVANARSVMATFWRVPASKQSDDLMGEFYTAGRSSSISGALKDAQDLLIKQPFYSHPYFWGAYFVVGDGSKTMLTPKGAVVAAR